MNDTETSNGGLTLRAIILGLVLAVVMGAANVYLGLKAGMTVSASIPAAVIGMLVLRAFRKKGSVLEANQIQTAASAGESLAAGIIFTIPAMVLIGVWTSFNWWLTTLIAFTGGLLGILFMIPMRRIFVAAKHKELTYPEGVACAKVLEAGAADDADPRDAMRVVKGALFGAGFLALIQLVGVLKAKLQTAFLAGKGILYFGSDISPMLIGVGYIVRLNIAVLIFLGGALAWLIALPLLGSGAEHSADLVDGAYTLWSTKIRYVGVGAMLVGGAVSIVKVRTGLVAAIRQIRGGAKEAEKTDTSKDISSTAILFWSLVATALVAGVYYSLTDSVGITLATTVLMLIASLFFTAVASYIVGLVGNSNSPVSGMTITAVLFAGAVLFLFGYTGTQGMIATLGVAAIVCCAACTSGDVCNDLKTGQLVGASPRRQQMMQIMGVGAACLVMAPVLQLLHTNTPGGIGGEELAAPQAQLFASLADGFFGESSLPWNMVLVGVIVGLFLQMIDVVLEDNGSRFRAHVMPIAVGMYLPFKLTPPILVGGLLAYWITKTTQSEEEAEKKLRPGVLFASGVIAGEALMGVILAILAGLGVTGWSLGLSPALVTALTVGGFVLTIILFRRQRAFVDKD